MSKLFALSLLAFSMIAPAHASVVLKEVTYRDGDTSLKVSCACELLASCSSK